MRVELPAQGLECPGAVLEDVAHLGGAHFAGAGAAVGSPPGTAAGAGGAPGLHAAIITSHASVLDAWTGFMKKTLP